MTDGEILRELARWFDLQHQERPELGGLEIPTELRRMADKLDVIEDILRQGVDSNPVAEKWEKLGR